MSTDTNQNSEADKVATGEASSMSPAIIGPKDAVDGPRIHLYTSLSSGSSSVLSPKYID
jgi:hypothetical protein